MFTMRKSVIAPALATMLLCVVAGWTPGSAQQSARVSPDVYRELQWRFVGSGRQPRVGGRRRARRFARLLRRQRLGRHLEDRRRRRPLAAGVRRTAGASIGALAVAPSDPNIVWAGTGEAWIRSHISIGDGIYKSTDAGQDVDADGAREDRPHRPRRRRSHATPTSSSRARSARLRSAAGARRLPHERRRQRRGSATLFVDENTGCSDVAMDPSNPRDPVRGNVADRDPHVGTRRAADPAAACSSRPTAASRGRD